VISGGGFIAGLALAFGVRPKLDVFLASRTYPSLAFDADAVVSDAQTMQSDASTDVSDTETFPEDVQDYFKELFPGAKTASARDFVRWLRTRRPAKSMTLNTMHCLHQVYCGDVGRIPLTERALAKQVAKHGIVVERAKTTIVDGKQYRPTMYRVKAQGERVTRRAA
jgi:hypothetical protein